MREDDTAGLPRWSESKGLAEVHPVVIAPTSLPPLPLHPPTPTQLAHHRSQPALSALSALVLSLAPPSSLALLSAVLFHNIRFHSSPSLLLSFPPFSSSPSPLKSFFILLLY